MFHQHLKAGNSTLLKLRISQLRSQVNLLNNQPLRANFHHHHNLRRKIKQLPLMILKSRPNPRMVSSSPRLQLNKQTISLIKPQLKVNSHLPRLLRREISPLLLMMLKNHPSHRKASNFHHRQRRRMEIKLLPLTAQSHPSPRMENKLPHRQRRRILLSKSRTSSPHHQLPNLVKRPPLRINNYPHLLRMVSSQLMVKVSNPNKNEHFMFDPS